MFPLAASWNSSKPVLRAAQLGCPIGLQANAAGHEYGGHDTEKANESNESDGIDEDGDDDGDAESDDDGDDGEGNEDGAVG